MKSIRKYSTFEKERKVFAAVMLVILACLVALFVLELTGEFERQEYQHQTEYPIANANVSWLQTYYGGTWNE